METSSPFEVEIALVKAAIEPLGDWEDAGTLYKLLDACSSAASDALEGTLAQISCFMVPQYQLTYWRVTAFPFLLIRQAVCRLLLSWLLNSTILW